MDTRKLNFAIKSDIVELNGPYRENNCMGVKKWGNNYKLISGLSPVLLSAPHAVRQYREGYSIGNNGIKGADVFTGGIVEYLCRENNCFGITRTFFKKDDPNFYGHGVSAKYKTAIRNLIKENQISLFLDIHGCEDIRGFDVCIGTNHGKNIQHNTELLEKLRSCLEKAGAKVCVDEELCASREHNVCRTTASWTNIPCFQIEISWTWRTQSEQLGSLVSALGSFIAEHSLPPTFGCN